MQSAPLTLEAYRPLRACFMWILLANAVYFLWHRFFWVPQDMPDGYLPQLAARFFEAPFYAVMGMTFLGTLIYGLCLLLVARSLPSDRPSRLLAFAAPLVGLPRAIARQKAARHTFFDTGIFHAIAPIRDAATLFPGVGFLGTVVGISLAIGGLTDILDGGEPAALLNGLRTAFDTTFLGLVAALALGVLVMVLDSTANRRRSSASA